MSRLPSIFLSYNPNSEFEETLAIRLQTIGAVHGFNMYLPDRYSDKITVSAETRNRIKISDYFILFSTAVLSKTVKDEIDIAFNRLKDKSKILVIYDINKGNNSAGAKNCTEIYVDNEQPVDKILEEILYKINRKSVRRQSQRSVIGSLLMAGLSLLLLGTLLEGSSKAAK